MWKRIVDWLVANEAWGVAARVVRWRARARDAWALELLETRWDHKLVALALRERIWTAEQFRAARALALEKADRAALDELESLREEFFSDQVERLT